LGGALAALGAMTTGAWSLMATRAGGALSDAGAAPASMAMLADMYPPEQRSRVMSVFSAGASFGALLALVVGAWLAQRHGWRATVALVGAASLTMALLLRATVRPLPMAVHASAVGSAPRGAVAEVWRLPVARSLILATGFALVAGYAFGAWNLSLLVRRHGLDLQAAGMVSTAAALASVGGSLWGGALADRLSRHDLRWQLGVPMLGIALALPCSVGYLLLPPGALVPAVALVAGFSLFISWWAAPVYAALSLVVPPRRRATANAMMLMAGAVVGTGVGPLGVGWLSDLLARLGADASPGGSLRWALLGAMAMLLPCLLLLLQALRAYPAARQALLAGPHASGAAIATASSLGAR
jgi:MFS family permease